MSEEPNGTGPPEETREHGERRRRRRTRTARPGLAQRLGVPIWLRRSPVEPSLLLKGLLAVIVVGSVLAIGSVHPPVMLVFGALSAVAFAVALGQRLGNRPAVPLLWPTLTLVALAGFTALQLVPLPLAWLDAIAPRNADVWARALLPFGEGAPAVAPISLDPGASWIEVVRWLSYAGVFAAAAVVGAKDGARWGVGLVYASAIIAAVCTIAHGLVGATEVFGLYEPSFRPRPWHVGPLLNPNNLSGYLNLGIFCGLGLVLSDEPPAPRWVLGVGIAIALGVNVTSASRAGLLALPLVLLALAVTFELGRRRRSEALTTRLRARVLIGGSLALGVVLAVLAGSQKMWAELVNENMEKIHMLGWLEPMVGEYAWVGVGRGAFESVSPAFQPARGSVVYSHAENFVMQWCIEWGIPAAAAALAVFVWQFRPRRLGVGRNALATGAWFGVFVVLAQNLLDLGLEIPGLVFAAVVVLGSLVGGHERDLEPQADARLSRSGARILVSAAVLACTVGLAGAARNGLHDLAADRALLRTQMTAQASPRSEARRLAIRAHLRAAMLRHPADPYFPRLGGLLAWQEKDDNPIPWLQRALERALVNGRTHLLLAQVLMGSKVESQALLELRLAVENDPGLRAHAARMAHQWASSLDELLVTVPPGQAGAESLDALGRMADDRDVGAVCDRMALELDGGLLGPHERLAQDLVTRRASDDGCTPSEACQSEFDTHVEALATGAPRHSMALRLRARWMVASGEADEAERLLAAGCDQVQDQEACLRERAAVAAKIPGPERFPKAAQALMTAVCIDRIRCAKAASWVGQQHGSRSEWGMAVSSYQRAVRDDVTEARLLLLSQAASKAGMHAQAVRALERAKRLRGGPAPDIDKLLREGRAAAAAPLLGK